MNKVHTVPPEDLHSKLIIEATPSSEGTVVIEGQQKYLKTFYVFVYTEINQTIDLNSFVGCYKACDENGREFDAYSVQVDLLGTLTLKECSKWGEIAFMSDDDSVYNAKFVKWSSQCPLNCCPLINTE